VQISLFAVVVLVLFEGWFTATRRSPGELTGELDSCAPPNGKEHAWMSNTGLPCREYHDSKSSTSSVGPITCLVTSSPGDSRGSPKKETVKRFDRAAQYLPFPASTISTPCRTFPIVAKAIDQFEEVDPIGNASVCSQKIGKQETLVEYVVSVEGC